MSQNRVEKLRDFDQAVWLDFLERGFIERGELKKLLDEDGVRGVTSNPAIFEKAIVGSSEYDGAIKQMLSERDRSVADLYQSLAVADIQKAADVLRPIYDSSGGSDGFVSLEISPYLADDTEGSMAEAILLWSQVGRKNAMIKVPGTPEGLPVIRALIAQGINVNVTLLFSQKVYADVVDAYLLGLEELATKAKDLSHVASVASFFVSRIDTAVDKLLDEKIASIGTSNQKEALSEIKGKVAIANAKFAYRHYKTVFTSERWNMLAERGARPQQLLWASTGTKNKAYSDVLYVEQLIGANTVNTIPPATLEAFRDHGNASATLEQGVGEADEVMHRLAGVGLSLEVIAETLVKEGVALFAGAADSLLGAVASKREMLLGTNVNQQKMSLGAGLDKHLRRAMEEWRTGGYIRRIWARDKTMWTGVNEDKLLGWLTSVRNGLETVSVYQRFGEDIRRDGFTNVVILGMGGSSLGAEVLAKSFGQPGEVALHILNSTDPAQISKVEAVLDFRRTLFIVSSKSGGTLEANLLLSYFIDRVVHTVGENNAGRYFAAITDAGSSLEKRARRDGFRQVFFGDESIGGRYSVLSAFGLAPAALTKIDLRRFLEISQIMTHSCGCDVPPEENPGAKLGLAMGLAGLDGRDKVTICASSKLKCFGVWAEQLIAESTGKNGKALIPIIGEPLTEPGGYGPDRFFIDLRTDREADEADDLKFAALAAAGHPVVRITLKSTDYLGQEFFRFEMATAIAGIVLGINPFDQPDVEASKIRTRSLTSTFDKDGQLPKETPVATSKEIAVYADARNADTLRAAGAYRSVSSWLNALFGQLRPGDYVALLAYVAHDAMNQKVLEAIRIALKDRYRAPTTIGFGPRYLHSTGQAHKGGPNTGIFLQITADDKDDLPIPGYPMSFGLIKAAQARGDYEVLAERGRRILRVHLKGDIAAGLAAIGLAVEGTPVRRASQ